MTKKINTSKTSTYKTIDLFCGIGGIRKGFELTNKFSCVLSAEIDKYTCMTYEHLFNENPLNDVSSEEFKERVEAVDYDVLLAGFPCQSFSIAGAKKGFEDSTRGTLFFDVADILKRTILATGGSGKERNLIVQEKPEYYGMMFGSKKMPINDKGIRVMTPREWSRLQGFKDYAFIQNGVDAFSFPKGVSETQQYKQLGNSVSIPVIEELAKYMYKQLEEFENYGVEVLDVRVKSPDNHVKLVEAELLVFGV